jgi:hypothetical protein
MSINLTNAGFLATATEQELQMGTAKPVTVNLCLSSKAQLVKGQPTTSIDVLQGGQTTQLSWTIQVKVPSMNWVVIDARTPKGGVDKIHVTIIALPHKTLVFTKPMKP